MSEYIDNIMDNAVVETFQALFSHQHIVYLVLFQEAASTMHSSFVLNPQSSRRYSLGGEQRDSSPSALRLAMYI